MASGIIIDVGFKSSDLQGYINNIKQSLEQVDFGESINLEKQFKEQAKKVKAELSKLEEELSGSIAGKTVGEIQNSYKVLQSAVQSLARTVKDMGKAMPNAAAFQGMIDQAGELEAALDGSARVIQNINNLTKGKSAGEIISSNEIKKSETLINNTGSLIKKLKEVYKASESVKIENGEAEAPMLNKNGRVRYKNTPEDVSEIKTLLEQYNTRRSEINKQIDAIQEDASLSAEEADAKINALNVDLLQVTTTLIRLRETFRRTTKEDFTSSKINFSDIIGDFEISKEAVADIKSEMSENIHQAVGSVQAEIGDSGELFVGLKIKDGATGELYESARRVIGEVSSRIEKDPLQVRVALVSDKTYKNRQELLEQISGGLDKIDDEGAREKLRTLIDDLSKQVGNQLHLRVEIEGEQIVREKVGDFIKALQQQFKDNVFRVAPKIELSEEERAKFEEQLNSVLDGVTVDIKINEGEESQGKINTLASLTRTLKALNNALDGMKESIIDTESLTEEAAKNISDYINQIYGQLLLVSEEVENLPESLLPAKVNFDSSELTEVFNALKENLNPESLGRIADQIQSIGERLKNAFGALDNSEIKASFNELKSLYEGGLARNKNGLLNQSAQGKTQLREFIQEYKKLLEMVGGKPNFAFFDKNEKNQKILQKYFDSSEIKAEAKVVQKDVSNIISDEPIVVPIEPDVTGFMEKIQSEANKNPIKISADIEGISTNLGGGSSGLSLVDVLKGWREADQIIRERRGVEGLSERGVLFNSRTKNISNPFTFDKGAAYGFFNQINELSKAYNVYVHSHPGDLATFSPQDITNILKGFRPGIEKGIVTALNEISIIDYSKINASQREALSKQFETPYWDNGIDTEYQKHVVNDIIFHGFPRLNGVQDQFHGYTPVETREFEKTWQSFRSAVQDGWVSSYDLSNKAKHHYEQLGGLKQLDFQDIARVIIAAADKEIDNGARDDDWQEYLRSKEKEEIQKIGLNPDEIYKTMSYEAFAKEYPELSQGLASGLQNQLKLSTNIDDLVTEIQQTLDSQEFKIKLSLGEGDLGGDFLKSLNTALSKLSNKNSTSNLETVAKNLTTFREALRQFDDLNDSSFLNQINQILASGEKLDQLSEILKADSKTISEVKKATQQEQGQDFVNNNYQQIIDNFNQLAEQRNWTVINSELKSTKSGFAELTSFIKTVGDEYQKIKLSTKDGMNFDVKSVKSDNTGFAKTIKAYEQYQDTLSEEEKELLKIGENIVLTPDSRGWAELVNLIEKFGISLEDVSKIIQTIDREGYESFQIFDSDGSTRTTLGINSDEILYFRDTVVDVNSTVDTFRNKIGALPNQIKGAFSGNDVQLQGFIQNLESIQELYEKLSKYHNLGLIDDKSFNELKGLFDAFPNSINSLWGNNINTSNKTQDFLNQLESAREAGDELAKSLEKISQGQILDSEDISNLNKFVDAVREVNTLSKDKSSMAVDPASIDKLLGKIYNDLNNNPAMARGRLGAQFRELAAEIEKYGKSMNAVDFKKFTKQFQALDTQLKKSGQVGKDFWDKLKEKTIFNTVSAISRLFSLYDIIRYVRTAINAIIQLDDALVDLKKTTSMTSTELEQFYYDANEVAIRTGVTTAEIIQAAADWSRLGYSTKEAATQMAELSSQFAAVSPGMSTEKSQEG